MKNIEVVAAVIVKDGKYLATQRGYGDLKGKWEFPGGKIEKGETFGTSLKREIIEEMHIHINVLDQICTIEYDYPTFHLIMHTFLCSMLEDDIPKVHHDKYEFEHDNYKWLDKEELYSVDWLPADILVLDKLNFYIKQNSM